MVYPTSPSKKKFRWTVRVRTWSSPPSSARISSILLDAPFSKCQGLTRKYYGPTIQPTTLTTSNNPSTQQTLKFHWFWLVSCRSEPIEFHEPTELIYFSQIFFNQVAETNLFFKTCDIWYFPSSKLTCLFFKPVIFQICLHSNWPMFHGVNKKLFRTLMIFELFPSK